MWCKHCGQDVPAFSSTTTSAARCARCGATADDDLEPSLPPIAAPVSAEAQGFDLASLPPGVETLANFEDWDIEQSFRQLQARLGISSAPAVQVRAPQPHDHATRRIDSAHATFAGRHQPQSRDTATASFVAWSLLTLGMMTFSCGVALMGWSILESRPELWNVGVPLAAGGQMGLLLGLGVQLERAWRNSRHTLKKLAEVDEQLNSLERTTNLLGMTHGSASQAFYAHMAEQANPHLLLADLKGQLDLLATNISKRKS